MDSAAELIRMASFRNNHHVFSVSSCFHPFSQCYFAVAVRLGRVEYIDSHLSCHIQITESVLFGSVIQVHRTHDQAGNIPVQCFQFFIPHTSVSYFLFYHLH